MNKIILLLAFLLTSNVLFSTDNSLFFQKQFLLDTSVTIKSNIIAPQINNHKLYFLYTRGKNNLELWENGKESFKHIVEIPNTTGNYYFTDFILKDSILFISEFHNFFVFKKENNSFKLIDSIHFTFAKSEIKIFDDTLYIISSSIQPYSNMNDLNIIKVNIANYEKVNVINLPSPDGIEFLRILPRRIMDCTNQYIAVASPSEYLIKFYSTLDGSFISELHNSSKEWRKYNKTIPDSIWRIRPSRFFSSVASVLDSINTIQSISFIDNKHLVVVWNSIDSLKQPSEIWDFWVKKDNIWDLVNSKSYLKSYNINEKYQIDNYNHFQFINKKKDFLLILDFPFESNLYLDKSIQILRKDIENYYIENNPRLSVFWWEWNEK